MPKYNKPKTEVKLFIIPNGKRKRHYIEDLTDPVPTIFETISTVEARFNVLVGYDNIETFNKYEGKTITIGLEYPETDITISAKFTVKGYERRFGNSKGPIITHVLLGDKD